MQNYKSKFKIFLIFIVVFVALFVIFISARRSAETVSGAFDVLAQCLADKGAVMYGADWCPHCQNEKKAFGDSFRLIPYVECPKNPQKCLEASVQGYPTWIFSDARRFIGEQGIEKLARESGCPVGKNTK